MSCVDKVKHVILAPASLRSEVHVAFD